MLRAGGGVSVIMVVLSYVLALRQRSIYIPSTGYVGDYHVIQQAQQATVTGMGLGDGARGAYEATIVVLAPASREALFLSPRTSRRLAWTVVIVVL